MTIAWQLPDSCLTNARWLPDNSLYHKWDVKTGFNFALQLFMLISDCLGGVQRQTATNRDQIEPWKMAKRGVPYIRFGYGCWNYFTRFVSLRYYSMCFVALPLDFIYHPSFFTLQLIVSSALVRSENPEEQVVMGTICPLTTPHDSDSLGHLLRI